MSTNAPTRRTHRKRTIAFVAAALVAIGGGTAYAWWSTTGTGAGSASTGTAGVVAVGQVGEVGGLAPGAPAQPLAGTITNDSSSALYVASVTVSISSVTKAEGAPAGDCGAEDYVLTQPSFTPTDVAAGASTPWSGAQIAFDNQATNQDGCQGAIVNLTYTVG